jgi:hypothetical protein
MSINHHTPLPAPRPLCAVFRQQLPLLALGKLDVDEATAVRTHLVVCEYCQVRLHEYEILARALYQHFGVGQSQLAGASPSMPGARSLYAEVPTLFTLEDIIQASQQERPIPTTLPGPRPSDVSRRRRPLTMIGALAAVLVVAALAATLVSHRRTVATSPAARPTPTVAASRCDNAVELGTTSFVPPRCTIKAGEAIRFFNPSQNSTQWYICLGVNGIFQPNPDGPAELNSPQGVSFPPGSSRSVIFAKAGVYHLTSPNPGAQGGDLIPNLTVTVLAG